MFGGCNIFETFLTVVKRITVLVMALHTLRGVHNEPVHELDALFAFISVIAKRIPSASAQLRLPVVVMDLYPPMRIDHSDFAVGQANETTNRTGGDHSVFLASGSFSDSAFLFLVFFFGLLPAIFFIVFGMILTSFRLIFDAVFYVLRSSSNSVKARQ